MTYQIKDFYPSRGDQTAKLIERKDPVVYASSANNSPINRSLVKQYEEQGFIILEDVFSVKEVASFQQELDRLKNDNTLSPTEQNITELGSEEIRSIFKIHDSSTVFKNLASDTRLAGLAQYLLADDVYIHQSRINYKQGFRGKEFYWHSDFETWHVEDGMPRMRALSMSITLTENYVHNGPLMLIPGSHKHFIVCEGETPEKHYESSLKQQDYGIPDEDSLFKMTEHGGIVSATGKPGSVIVFDSNVMHGSNGNITPFPRSNVFFVYNAISNQVLNPFGNNPPRPEAICSRKKIAPIKPLLFEAQPE